MKTKVFLIDRHAVTRAGLRHLVGTQLDLTVCGECHCCQEGAIQLAALDPDLVVMEPLCRTGLRTDVIARLRHEYPELLIFGLSVGDDATHAERVLRAGANGYLSKDHNAEEILAGIRQVLDGNICVAKSVTNILLRKLTDAPGPATPTAVPVDHFSDRELEIFNMIGLGQATGQIAAHLNLSISTVETYRLRLKEKLHVTTATELNRCAICWVEGRQQNHCI
jgi:DNA-binding NarL/FixJ family response regulator